MAHTSFYRKYRPATFDDVVGQQHIERTLRNAVAEGSVAHAYLFSGPRGTGKTTTARLLAKALLCERGPTGEPDATCEQCIEIAEGRHPDVYELDAASRTGVDNVREEIIGRVNIAAARGRYKVYIIDEVHMLSAAAFNALLKTLEEPPAHVVFVMCTTHPNKVPETIQSRCQRFDFHRLSVEDIADRLRYIAEAEGLRVDRSAFTLIARHAEGGMRDAITALEQLAAFSGGEITSDDVEGMLGQVDSEQIFELASLIARRDIAGGFRWIADVVETGTDLNELVRELTAHVRDLFVIAAVGEARGIVDRTAEDVSRLEAQVVEFGGPDRITRILDVLGELATEMRWSSDPRLSIEVALTRIARPRGELTLEALAERIESLEHGVVAGAVTPADAPAASPKREVAAAPAKRVESATCPAPEPVVTSVRKPGTLDRAAVKRDWQAVLLEIKKSRPARAHTFADVEVDVDTDGQGLVIQFPAGQEFSKQLAEEPEMREIVKKALIAVFGAAFPFRYQLGRGGVRPAEPEPHAPASASAEPHVDVAPDADEEPPAAAAAAAAEAAQAASESGHSASQGSLESGHFEMATGMSEPAIEVRPEKTVSAVEKMLTGELGATIIDENGD